MSFKIFLFPTAWIMCEWFKHKIAKLMPSAEIENESKKKIAATISDSFLV